MINNILTSIELIREIRECKYIPEIKRMEAMQYAMTEYNNLPSCKELLGSPLYSYAMCQKNNIVYEKTLSKFIK